MVTFDVTEDLVGGASIDSRRTPITDETMQAAKDADAILFGSVGGPKWDKLGFDLRPEIAILRLRKELDIFANLRPGDRVRSAGGRLDPEARRDPRPGYHDRPRKHRWHLLRRTARRGDAGGRAEARLRHRNLHHQRDRTRRPRGLRTRPQAPEPRVQRREGQRHAIRPVLAPDRHGAARARVPGRGADPHVRRQLRHAVVRAPASST